VKFAQQFEQQHPHLLQIDAAIASLRLRKKTPQSQQHATASIIYGTRAALNP
jgi:hypothetical protein